MFAWTAFVFGILSSVHCAGMCGPIALALPSAKNSSRPYFIFSRILYNSGRVLTYTFLGLLIGFLGKGIALAGYQQGISITLGLLLLLMAIFSINPERITEKMGWMRKFYQFISRKLGKKLQKPNALSFLSIGVLNGFLPCGIVYIALLASLAFGGIQESAAYMFLFGLGTFPMMLSLSLLGGWMQLKYRKMLQKSVPYVIGIFAILLILRGLNLGIPLISPMLGESVEAKPSCH